MKYSSDLIVGWCPGALKPFESGDGLIVRVRLHLGRMSLVQLETLASAAERFGDGNLYLSNRANVQLRGVTGDKHAAAPGCAGLGPPARQRRPRRSDPQHPGFAGRGTQRQCRAGGGAGRAA